MKTKVSIDPRRTALLLIDLQDEQRHNPLYPVEDFDAVVANARRLLIAARERNIAIFHSAYRRDFDLRPPRALEPRTPGGGPVFSDKANPLTAICKEVEPLAGESVIYKNDASAFCEGDLHPLLSQAGIEWLVVAGVWTEACVAASVRDAMAFGLRVLLVKDACGSGTKAMHQTGILNLANRLYGGAVADTGRILKLFAGESAEVWASERPVPNLFSYADAADRFDQL